MERAASAAKTSLEEEHQTEVTTTPATQLIPTMAMTKPTSAKHKKPPATFEVVFSGQNITPEKLPLRVIADSLGAVQRLASGLDLEAASTVPETDAIGLLDIKRGSAVFSCVARNPVVAKEHLRWTGEVLTAVEPPAESDPRPIDFILWPVRTLSQFAKALDCSIMVREPGTRNVLAIVEATSWDRLSRTMLTTGPTTQVGKVVRVGGATHVKCSMRIPGRDRLLYCDVPSDDVARRLGQHLYEEVTVSGTATWLQRGWKLLRLEIHTMQVRSSGGYLDVLDQLYKIGGNAWDEIGDHEDYIRGLRK